MQQAQTILDIYAREIGGDPTRVAEDKLHVNAVAQPLVCALQLATWAALRDNLPEPRAIAGYSVGELAAYGCAGALEPGEVIQLAKRRALEMDAATPGEGGLMAVRGLDLPTIRVFCGKFGVEIAIVNDFDRLVIGGPREALAHCAEAATAAGGKVTPLNIAIASHTSLMRPAVENFRAALEAAHWRAAFDPGHGRNQRRAGLWQGASRRCPRAASRRDGELGGLSRWPCRNGLHGLAGAWSGRGPVAHGARSGAECSGAVRGRFP